MSEPHPTNNRNRNDESIYLSQIDRPDPNNGRLAINPARITSMALSLSTLGQLQPIIVVPNEGRFTLLAGNRRYLAAKQLNWQKLWALIRDPDDTGNDTVTFEENFQRVELTPLEEAAQLHDMIEQGTLTVAQLAVRVRRSENWIADRLEMLHYSDAIQQAIQSNKLKLGPARFLSRIPGVDLQAQYLRYALTNGVTTATARLWLQNAVSSLQAQTEQNENVTGSAPICAEFRTFTDCAFCRESVELIETIPLRICKACHSTMDATLKRP